MRQQLFLVASDSEGKRGWRKPAIRRMVREPVVKRMVHVDVKQEQTMSIEEPLSLGAQDNSYCSCRLPPSSRDSPLTAPPLEPEITSCFSSWPYSFPSWMSWSTTPWRIRKNRYGFWYSLSFWCCLCLQPLYVPYECLSADALYN